VKRLLATLTAVAVVAGIGATVAAPSADAASRPMVGSIYLRSWTKPYHSYLRTSVDAVTANGSNGYEMPGWVTYRIWRHTSAGWRLVKSRTAWDVLDWPLVHDAYRDVEEWPAWGFNHAGRYRWEATLHTRRGTVSTAYHYFRVYYR
jgi:hypothetical protein